jgi:hypothetical protein
MFRASSSGDSPSASFSDVGAIPGENKALALDADICQYY